MDVTPEFKAAVAGVGEAGWHDLHRQADGRRTSTGQQWAEVPFVPNWIGHSKHSPEYRFIAIREPLRNPPLPGMAGQLNLAVPTMEMPGGGWYKVFGLVTNRDIDPEELELLPGSLTPGLGEILVRLGAWLPFEPARRFLADWARLHPLREARVRRPTEAAGATYVAIQAAARALEAGWELPGSGSARPVLAVDRAMVPLVGGEWAAVQTLVIGEVAAAGSRKGMSYFSRLSDAASFAQQALAETAGGRWAPGELGPWCPTGPNGFRGSETCMVRAARGFWTFPIPRSTWRTWVGAHLGKRRRWLMHGKGSSFAAAKRRGPVGYCRT